MKVSRRQSSKRPFVLDATELERLGKSLEELTPRLTFEASCKDGLKREFSSMLELLNFEHPPKKEIKTLRIAGYSEDLTTRIWLSYDKSLTRNVYLSLEGEEAPVLLINDIVDEHLERIQPWYSVLARLDLMLVLCFVWTGLTLAFGLLPAILSGTFREWFSQGLPKSFSEIMIPVLIALSVVLLGLTFNLLKATVFPMGVFAIGQGAKRHKDKEVLRTVVIIGSLISLISSLIVTVIFSR